MHFRRTVHWLSAVPLALLTAVSLCSCESKPGEEPPAAEKGEPAQQEAAKPTSPATGDIAAPANVAAPPADAEKTSTGLASAVLKPGTGSAHPSPESTVRVHYSGWTKDGKMFDSSVKRGQPAQFGLNRVIKGWTEGIPLMVVGEKRRFWIPGELAYGETPRRPGAPAGQLTFDVELLEIVEPPKAPEDVGAAPADASKTASGLRYKILSSGAGGASPKSADSVSVHYSGWTPDGKLFDSSVTRGRPARFALNRVIGGWTEGLQLMKKGDKARLWIPGKLAYGELKEGQPPGRPPKGPLVFDVELLDVMPAAQAKPAAAKPSGH